MMAEQGATGDSIEADTREQMKLLATLRPLLRSVVGRARDQDREQVRRRHRLPTDGATVGGNPPGALCMPRSGVVQHAVHLVRTLAGVGLAGETSLAWLEVYCIGYTTLQGPRSSTIRCGSTCSCPHRAHAGTNDTIFARQLLVIVTSGLSQHRMFCVQQTRPAG